MEQLVQSTAIGYKEEHYFIMRGEMQPIGLRDKFRTFVERLIQDVRDLKPKMYNMDMRPSVANER